MCRRLTRALQQRDAYDKKHGVSYSRKRDSLDLGSSYIKETQKQVVVDKKTALQKEKEEFLKSLGLTKKQQ